MLKMILFLFIFARIKEMIRSQGKLDNSSSHENFLQELVTSCVTGSSGARGKKVMFGPLKSTFS
jgi:hypothetical protein